jgi:hypothetical protein
MREEIFISFRLPSAKTPRDIFFASLRLYAPFFLILHALFSLVRGAYPPRRIIRAKKQA